ncbi:SurA N-terminal domain-containing protein [Marinococcus sp. PL1-022]|uniref:SurA N-terminal domain-containing protein n=1 Tax=Marinococcus sp. PL1-022 TaxID=3095363 RepID=UPI0029C2FCCB|nr:SurA N-terminal domain-containing protein [Marinococcus sp. PL1-022]MDX6151423.1 SurA N-terminal domain-containing protein [Marinococcus sp. PL1-022]
MSKKWILSTGLALSVAIIGACSNGDGGENSSDNNNENEEQQSEENSNNNNENNQQENSDEGSSDEQASGEEQAEDLPEPDLSDVPDTVATVNGEEITKEEFEPIFTTNYEQYAAQAAASGDQSNEELQTDLKERTAESLIDQELLAQEAEAGDYEVNEEDIDEQISSLKEQFESDEEYQQALEEQGYTEEELREEARTSLQINALLDEQVEEVEVSDEEVEELYDQISQGQGEEAGSLEDLRPQLEQQLESQKQQEQQQEYTDQLREDADIENNVASESEGNSDSEE